MVATKAKKEIEVEYQSDVIAIEDTYVKNIDITKIPVFKIENCEVMFANLGAKTPKSGHSIRVMFPDNNFFEQDKVIRQKYLTSRQKQDPDLEAIKSSLKKYKQADILKGTVEESKLGRSFIDIKVSGASYYDPIVGEDGKIVETKIDKLDQSTTGKVIVKYFRSIDRYTGKGIEPKIYKYVNGERVYSFVNPKTQQETPLFVGTGDIVNIELRPYEFVNSLDGSISIKYNLLSVEIVQTAWDRGIGKKAGSGKSHVKEAPDTVQEADFSDIFGNLGSVIMPQEETIVQTQPKVETKPQVVAEAPKTKTVEVTNTVTTTVAEPVAQTQTTQASGSEIDFNALMSGLNNISSSDLGA